MSAVESDTLNLDNGIGAFNTEPNWNWGVTRPDVDRVLQAGCAGLGCTDVSVTFTPTGGTPMTTLPSEYTVGGVFEARAVGLPDTVVAQRSYEPVLGGSAFLVTHFDADLTDGSRNYIRICDALAPAVGGLLDCAARTP